MRISKAKDTFELVDALILEHTGNPSISREGRRFRA